MIVQLRLDERLIHGQITTAWSRFLNITAIIVANDKLAHDELAAKVLLMAAPAEKKVAVRTVENAMALLNDPRSESMRILVIVDNPVDALTIVENCDVKEVNVANYVKKKSKNKVALTRGCNADPEDLAIFKKLVETDARVFSQLIPSQAETDFTKIVRETEIPEV